jgi:hypothetical protein
MKPLPVLETVQAFPALHAELIRLLRSLEPGDWEVPTVAGNWRVRDVAAHLLDGDLRKLATHRDGHRLTADSPVESYEDVVSLITSLNSGGVEFGRRLSPRLMSDLLEITGRWVSDFVASLDPDAPALFAVAWAGESRSNNRFDTAREYTERWHHQMHIRAAVRDRGKPETLLAPEFLVPLFETCVRVLPHAYRDVLAEEGASIAVKVTSDPPMEWTLSREGKGWVLYSGESIEPTARVTSDPDMLWRLFFNALPVRDASDNLVIEGPMALIDPFLRARSVMV